MIDSDINNRKGSKPVDPILKPDADNYDPFSLLEYHPKKHVFMPNYGLEKTVFERVETMINTLHINDVKKKRCDFLRRVFRDLRFGDVSDDYLPEQFPTAFLMCKQLLDDGEIKLDQLS